MQPFNVQLHAVNLHYITYALVCNWSAKYYKVLYINNACGMMKPYIKDSRGGYQVQCTLRCALAL